MGGFCLGCEGLLLCGYVVGWDEVLLGVVWVFCGADEVGVDEVRIWIGSFNHKVRHL
jgi:hypothetical protein